MDGEKRLGMEAKSNLSGRSLTLDMALEAEPEDTVDALLIGEGEGASCCPASSCWW